MRYFPIFLDLKGRRAVIVGGGEEALRKARLLLKTEAAIDVVAPALHDELAAESRVNWLARRFEPAQLDGAALAYCADDALGTIVSAAAHARGIPVNVVDAAELSSFITPSIVDRDPVVVAIGTEGTAPMLGQGIRARIDALLPAGLGTLARLADALRPLVANQVPQGHRRRGFWQRFFFGAIRDAVLEGDDASYEAELSAALAGEGKPPAGRVCLVGAGPGDPELLTLKAQRKLMEADVILYDRAVGAAILEVARRDAIRLAVNDDSDITIRLAVEARLGRHAVWLRSGDGVVADVQAALQSAGLAVDVVPGIAWAPESCRAGAKSTADIVPFPVRDDIRAAVLRAAS